MSTKPLVISLITLSLISANAFGHTGESDSICKIAEVERDAGVDTSQKLVSGFTVGEIETLTARICQALVHAKARNSQNVGEEIETYILDFNGWDRQTPNYQGKVSEFWNQHNEQFICRNHGHRYLDQHFFIRVVEMKMYAPVFNDYMLQDESLYPFDMNAVQSRSGKNETVLDFVDKIINDPTIHHRYNMSEIHGLREVLVTFYDAKHANEVCP